MDGKPPVLKEEHIHVTYKEREIVKTLYLHKVIYRNPKEGMFNIITNNLEISSDEVTIFGDQMPITTLAEKLNTIPYEILTNVSERVKRVFFQD